MLITLLVMCLSLSLSAPLPLALSFNLFTVLPSLFTVLSRTEVTFDTSMNTGQQLYHTLSPDEMNKANAEYIQKIRQRLEEDAVAREQREKRRRRVLVEQLQAHEAQEVTTALLDSFSS